MTAAPTHPDVAREQVRELLARRRRRTLGLVRPLTDEELRTQYLDFLSPLVWDVGHIGNFEELWLLRNVDGRPPSDERLDHLYNAFENPRGVRGELEILPREPALQYLADVRGEVMALLDRVELDPNEPLLQDGYVYRMISQHEAQHQETMLQLLDIRTDLAPHAYELDPRPRSTRAVDDSERVTVPGGSFLLGTTDRASAYDNERPQHEVEVAAFAMDRYPVSNRRYAAFVADGGYARPELWSEGGRAWLAEAGHESPQGWMPDGDGGWSVRRMGHVLPLDPQEVLQHVSYWEAEAFCAWAGGRLPTEHEWEKAATWDPATASKRVFPWGDSPTFDRRANVGLRHLRPSRVGAYPDGASAYGIEQLVGDVYAWTSSDFVGYPGFNAFPYPEYSEVFFGGDYKVLRGASWAIDDAVVRGTYRNWDHPKRRQIFAGVRVAYDVSEG